MPATSAWFARGWPMRASSGSRIASSRCRERRAGLDGVTFQAQLGSLGARTDRIAVLAAGIGAQLGADESETTRAAQLAKCDLLTAMVGEFPDLQGVMGRYYALADGEAPRVAEAIREHYLPRGAGDALPGSSVGDAVALADKLDTLAGIFATGQKPTRHARSVRPAARCHRRAAHRARASSGAGSDRADRTRRRAAAARRHRAAGAERIGAEIYDFVIERARAQYLERAADNGISTEMFDAVLATRPASLLDFDARLHALVGFVARPEGASLAAANKRIANILRKSEAAPANAATAAAPPAVDSGLLREDAERELHRGVAARCASSW